MVPNKNYQCKLVSNNVYPLHELVLMTAWSCNEIYEYEYWSALSIAPTSALAGAKEAYNFTEFFLFFLLFYNHRTTTSRQPRMLKFDMQAPFNPTKRNIKKKKWGLLTPPSSTHIGLSLNLAVLLTDNLGI